MDVIYSLIPGMIFFGLIFVAVLVWAVKRGQYDDLDGDAHRILMDEDEQRMSRSAGKGKTSDQRWPDAE